MNDPHVESLIYRIKHNAGVDYANAPPLEHSDLGFSVRIENGEAKIRMIDHHATAENARAAVEPFLRAWELTAYLEAGPGEWQFVYDHSNVVDRKPTSNKKFMLPPCSNLYRCSISPMPNASGRAIRHRPRESCVMRRSI